ncbi:hypothetical protein DL771_002641 [Monosporascus sp. 5C6A]|nr:hypothetical protein DL771_002641 [Monosporascus sp. 5C6A]
MTRQFCPASVVADPINYYQGDDGADLPGLREILTATYPQSVFTQGTPYPVFDGYIGIKGRRSRSAQLPLEHLLGGRAATVFGSFVGSNLFITLTYTSTTTVTGPQVTTTFYGGPTNTRITDETTSLLSTPYFINAGTNVGNAYCFSEDQGCANFNIEEARQTVESFCKAGYRLDPGDTYGQVNQASNSGYGVYV